MKNTGEQTGTNPKQPPWPQRGRHTWPPQPGLLGTVGHGFTTGDVALIGTCGADGLAITGLTFVMIGLPGVMIGLLEVKIGFAVLIAEPPGQTAGAGTAPRPMCTRERTFVPFRATAPLRSDVRGMVAIARGLPMALPTLVTDDDTGPEITRPAPPVPDGLPTLEPRTVPCITGELEVDRMDE